MRPTAAEERWRSLPWRTSFEAPKDRVLRELARLDVNALTPMQALAKLAELVEVAAQRGAGTG